MNRLWNKCVVIITIIPVVIIVAYLMFVWFMRAEDISNEPTTHCRVNIPGHVWLISYADGGDVHFKNQRYLAHSAINKCIGSSRSYSLKDIDPIYQKDHAVILSQSRGAGYWLWKPYVILKTLESIPENDIVLYVDSGVFVIKPVDSLINHLNEHDIIVFKGEEEWKNKYYIKRDLLKTMNADNDNIRDMVQLQASYILLKNTQFSRNFVKKWLIICENEMSITDKPSKEEYPEFIDHRHDQSILTLLYASNTDKIYTMSSSESEKYFWHHRRREVKSDISLPKSRSLAEINKFLKKSWKSYLLFFRQFFVFST